MGETEAAMMQGVGALLLSSDPITERVEVAASHWAVFEVQAVLKMQFEVVMSRALQFLLDLPNLGSVDDEKVLNLRHFDTLSICTRLIQWSVAEVTEISQLFKTETALRSSSAPETLNAGALEESDTRHLLCKIVQQHAEHIAEFRKLVAHDIKSITPNECSTVLVSIKALLEYLRADFGMTRVTFPQFTRSRFSLETSEAKIFLATEAIFSLEHTIVKLFESFGDRLPVSVHCVSSLCALLRKENLHTKIMEVTGINPKPLTLKTYVYVDGEFRNLLENPSPRKRGLKTYSHLDLVYMARNLFNHATFGDVSELVISQWLKSTKVMIQAFAPADLSFSPVINHLERLQKLLSTRTEAIKVSVTEGNTDKGDNSSNLSLPRSKLRPKAGKAVVRMMKKMTSRSFVGREDILRRIQDVASTIGPDPRVIVLSGHPGNGKSYAALKASEQIVSFGHFQMHFWITATTKELLAFGLVNAINASDTLLADIKMPLEQLIEHTLEVCRQYSCYFIFDDVTQGTLGAVRQIMTSFDVQGLAVITTCIKHLNISPCSEEMEVEALTIAESFKLLEYITRGHNLPLSMTQKTERERSRLWEQIEAHRKAVENIVEKALGRSPLGVALLGQLLVSEKSFESVEKMLSDSLEGFSPGSDAAGKRYFAQQHSGLETTVRCLLNPIRHNRRLLSRLYAISLLSPNGIPVRLLSNFGDETCEQQSFIENEMAALESVGLVQMSTSEEGIAYVMVHQLTQQALRQVLPTVSNIDPSEICEALVEGWSRDLRLDFFCGVFMGRGLISPHEAVRWANCVLFSSLAQQIAKICFEVETEDRGVSLRRKFVDGLFLALFLLQDLYPRHLKTIYRRLFLLKAQKSGPHPHVLTDIFLKVEDYSSEEPDGETLEEMSATQIQDILLLCWRQGIAIEFASYFFAGLFEDVGLAGLILTLDSSVKGLFAEKKEARRPDLINVHAGLLGGSVALELCQTAVRSSDALELLEQQIKELKPDQKFFNASRSTCQYYVAVTLYRQAKYDQALALLGPLLDEYFADENHVAWAIAGHVKAMILMGLDRLLEAQELLEKVLQINRRLFSEQGSNQRRTVYTLLQLSDCHSRQNDFEPAEKYFLAAEELCAKLKSPHLLPVSQKFIICWLYWRWGKYTLAWEWTKRRRVEYASGMKQGDKFSYVAYCSWATPLYALGPTKAAQEIDRLKLMEDSHLIKEKLKTFQFLNRDVTNVHLGMSRASLWLDKYEDAWGFILEAHRIALELDISLIWCAQLRWSVSVQLLSTAIQSSSKGIALSLIPQADVSSSISEEVLSPAASEVPEDVPELLRTCWTECVMLADVAKPLVDVAWYYEYARVLLWVSEDKTLQKTFHTTRLPVSHEEHPEPTKRQILENLVLAEACALVEEATSALEAILVANVEVTEWHGLAKDLLVEYKFKSAHAG